MSKSRNIPTAIRCMLWGRAAGRCEFSGCNRPLSFHSKTKETVNLAETAHIIGLSEDGPRGEKDLSDELAKDIANLMLVCQECHQTIDTNKQNYPVDLLLAMKLDHESRVSIVAGINADKQSHVLLYGTNVGEHSSPVSNRKAVLAMLPDWYPAETTPILLGMVNSSFRERSEEFWQIESAQLRNMIAQEIRPRLASGSIQHLSVFAFAPQPLLILLGFLLSDIPAAEVYQLHREPPDWKWQGQSTEFKYVVQEPDAIKGPPALVLSLSATITNERITSALEGDASIWRVTIAESHNDFLKSRKQLRKFRETMRLLLDRIKVRHGENSVLHVFPATPVAVAVEMGRIIMPKADLQMRIYDENKSVGGFIFALDINSRPRFDGGA